MRIKLFVSLVLVVTILYHCCVPLFATAARASLSISAWTAAAHFPAMRRCLACMACAAAARCASTGASSSRAATRSTRFLTSPVPRVGCLPSSTTPTLLCPPTAMRMRTVMVSVCSTPRSPRPRWSPPPRRCSTPTRMHSTSLHPPPLRWTPRSSSRARSTSTTFKPFKRYA